MFKKSIDTAYDLIDPERKYLLLVDEEGQEGGGGGEVTAEAEDGDQEAAQGEQEASEGGSDKDVTAAESSDDWRAGIKDPDARKLAESSTDIDHLAKRLLDMRKKMSSAIIKPGDDAAPEDIAAYRNAMDIPEDATGYEFPDLPEGMELTEEIEQSREAWSKRFHDLNIPASAAKELARLVNEDSAAYEAAQIEADKAHADEAEAALRKEWRGSEYDLNIQHMNRAAAEIFGADLDDVRHLELKNGRFALDDPRMVRALAKVGREMSEGTLGDVMTEADRDRTQNELSTVRDGIMKAREKGDNDEANRLYQKEMAIIAKMNGTQSIVGANGRAA